MVHRSHRALPSLLRGALASIGWLGLIGPPAQAQAQSEAQSQAQARGLSERDTLEARVAAVRSARVTAGPAASTESPDLATPSEWVANWANFSNWNNWAKR